MASMASMEEVNVNVWKLGFGDIIAMVRSFQV